MRETVAALTGMVLTAAIGAVGGVLGGLIYAHAQEPPMRVRVLDMRRLVELVASDPSLDDEGRRVRTREVSEQVSAIVSEHASHGTLILDGSAVLRAPASAYMEP